MCSQQQNAVGIPFSVQFVNLPHVILLGNYDYDFYFTVSSLFNSKENISIRFLSKDFDVSVDSSYIQGIPFEPGESKQIIVKCKPRVDGLSELTVEVIHNKIVEYTELVWKVREKIDESLVNSILSQSLVSFADISNYRSQLPTTVDRGDLTPLTRSEAEKEISNFENPPPFESSPSSLPHEENESSLEGEGLDAPVSSMQENRKSLYETSTPEQRDTFYINIARRVFTNDPSYGYEVLKKVSNANLRLMWLEHFIPCGITLDYKSTLSEILQNLPADKQEKYLEMLAYGIALVNPQDASMVALNISNEAKKNEVLINIIFNLASRDPDIASNLVYHISDGEMQKRVLFELIKRWAEKDKEKAINALKSLITNILSGANQEFIIQCMVFLAYLTSPSSVIDLINSFENKEEKELLIEQLKTHLQYQAEEKRTRVDPVLLLKQTFSFVSVVSLNNPSFEYLARLGGNVSPYLVSQNDASLPFLFLNLFGHNFSYGYTFLQLYRNFEKQKPFSYILFPSLQGLNEEESHHLRTILQTLRVLVSSRFSSAPPLIIVFDMIPYLSLPTVYFSEVQKKGETLQEHTQYIQKMSSALQRVFSESIKIDTSCDFFGRGSLHDLLSSLFSEFKDVTFVNVVLSYNFFNDFNLLNQFFKVLFEAI